MKTAQAHTATPKLTLAQRSNFAPPTAQGYMLWRQRSLTLLAGQPFSLERERRLFLYHARPQAGQRWLDIGTGAGFYAGVLAAADCRVMALDISPAMLEVARRTHPNPRIQYVQANAEALGKRYAGQFDGVTIGATLNETANPAALLQSAARALRAGGQLWQMYLVDTGGPLQRLLAAQALGGLSFPTSAFAAAQLPTMRLQMGLEVGAARLERWTKPCDSDMGKGSGETHQAKKAL